MGREGALFEEVLSGAFLEGNATHAGGDEGRTVVKVGRGVDNSGGRIAEFRTPRMRRVRMVGRVPSDGLELEELESESVRGYLGADVIE